jgi:secondary thiamine-phosphate synthase enzyme
MPGYQYSGMYRKEIQVTTAKEGDIIDITPEVREIVRESRVSEGMVHVFVTGSTAAVTTIEYEPGVLADLSRALSVLAPDTLPYAHDSRWGDGNGRSHVKAAIVGPSLSVPVTRNSPALGTWQQVVLLELDIRAGRSRSIIVTVTE